MDKVKIYKPFGSIEITPGGRRIEHNSYSCSVVCRNCKGYISENDAYCRHCGSPLSQQIKMTIIYNYNTNKYEKYDGDVEAPPSFNS